MIFTSDWIRQRRQALGLTQTQLAVKANMSLPTLQNLEAGKGNPSWDILTKLCQSLGYSIHFRPRAVNWSDLSQIGVPVTDNKSNENFDLAQGLFEFKIALHEFVNMSASFNERQREAFCGFLWALRDHYPSRFAKFKKVISSKDLDQHIKKFPLGRMIKLRRLALAQINPKVFA